LASAARYGLCFDTPFLGVLSKEDVRICHDFVFGVKGKAGNFFHGLSNSCVVRNLSVVNLVAGFGGHGERESKVPSLRDSIYFLCVPGTYVPGFPIPPLRGLSIVRPTFSFVIKP
jgi:hypothetical protein